MRIRRTLPVFLAVALAAVAVTVAIQLRKHAPPEAARLLPGADGFLYANLGWVRKANAGRALTGVAHDPEYQKFIEETGIEFERDLDQIAFAAHYPSSWPGGGTGGTANEPRFSEVFTGKFDGVKLAGYLKQQAKSVESYNAVDIFAIPLQQRTFRVAILGVDTVAASNHDDPQVIRGIIDRSRRLASPFGGPALLRRYYKRVQFASPVWLVAHIQPSQGSFGGWGAILPKPADLIVSASYNPLHLPLGTGTIHLRAEALTGSAEDARSIADKVNVFLTMFHAAESNVGTGADDADIKTLFDSLKVRQEDERAVLSAVMTPGFLRKMLAESGEMPGTESISTPTATPAKQAAGPTKKNAGKNAASTRK